MRLSLVSRAASLVLLLWASIGLSAQVPAIPAPASAQMTHQVFHKKKLDKVKYVQAYQKSLASFEQVWTVRFSGIFPSQAQAQIQKAVHDKLKNVRNWDAYMNAFLGDKVGE